MNKGKELRIISLLCLDSAFFLIELSIGYMSHSLALIADSFHMLNDILSLVVALWAVNVAKERTADAKYTYGWKRAEILGALINAVFLLALCFSIIIQAIQRLVEPEIIQNPKLVMYVGFAGLLSNVIGIFLFNDHGPELENNQDHARNADLEDSPIEDGESAIEDGTTVASAIDNQQEVAALTDTTINMLSEEETSLLSQLHKTPQKPKRQKSLNMHGVFLHVMGDALGNIGVIVAALIMWKTELSWKYYTDPLISLFITVIIFSSALPLSRKASKILLQATPSDISAEKIRKQILQVPGVITVHEFHIWNLTETINIASIHVNIDATSEDYLESAKLIRDIFHKNGIHSATVQPEFVGNGANAYTRRRFSEIAGGPVTTGTLQTSYGSTTSETGCLIDDAVNCCSDKCLPK
ncbi:hypothetical protein KAFR_0B03570 [Kazachstania africana CBS 2517]|uniref:Zinc/cadmium resistance protein n=1 Tax=Kazachstania africana (strain ATCC 22294 / BCRC 22015 / CBS 2517 / CECT 1963 / NBRC 1671 / NRRL Y-8276) TaxID=1071382 RepID=H2AQK4_KAZAF|nr:hypothetical protein KAFR_0B03570 [Kazachstania africana CBS 2517]CCF56654.1 hypothetical protein KAFR_0B03570 [Kazachstania africana CBS 2517]